MVDYVLKRDSGGMVRYLYRNDGKHPYVGRTKIESAEWMLRQGEVVVSEEYEGFPVTANGMYFFDAEIKGGGGEGEATAPNCGLDCCEISEAAVDGTDGAMIQTGVNADIVKASDIGAEKPKKRRRRVKDAVCE